MAGTYIFDAAASVKRPPRVEFTSSATGTYECGDAAIGVVGSYVFQVISVATFTLSFKKRIRGSAESWANVAATWYEDTAAGPDSIAGSTAVSAAGNYKVYCDSCEVAIVVATNNGSVVVEMAPEKG